MIEIRKENQINTGITEMIEKKVEEETHKRKKKHENKKRNNRNKLKF